MYKQGQNAGHQLNVLAGESFFFLDTTLILCSIHFFRSATINCLKPNVAALWKAFSGYGETNLLFNTFDWMWLLVCYIKGKNFLCLSINYVNILEYGHKLLEWFVD